MRKLSIGTLLIALLLVGLSNLAMAADPTGDTPFTFWEASATPGGAAGGYNPAIPTGPEWGATSVPNGASYWSYNDYYDGGGAWAERKTEGSYRGYDNQSSQQYTRRSTHQLEGLYDTTGNDCKTCHAVHRANGSFFLMRADSPNDACSYCHVGDHRHALQQAYKNGDGSVYPRNGHTIGSGKYIPDSTTWQWLANTTLEAKGDNLSGTNNTETISVRRYNDEKNKLFKWSMNYDGKYVRSGPTYLTCMSCHQPHNAKELRWEPNSSFTDGHKLLRANPSGSINSRTAMEGYEDTTTESDIAFKAPEGTLSAATTLTGYTQWQGTGLNASIEVNAWRLSVWCANCHNLNIGASKAVADNWRSKSHTDRTHPVPATTEEKGDIDCWNCHQAKFEEGDFPHSGNPDSTKILGQSYAVTDTVNGWDPVANEHLNQICMRCHIDPDDPTKGVGLTY